MPVRCEMNFWTGSLHAVSSGVTWLTSLKEPVWFILVDFVDVVVWILIIIFVVVCVCVCVFVSECSVKSWEMFDLWRRVGFCPLLVKWNRMFGIILIDGLLLIIYYETWT